MARTPTPKFVTLGTSSKVHVVRSKAHDLANSKCVTVRKAWDNGKIVPNRSLSASAALALDPCNRCQTHTVAKAESADDEKAARQDKRNEVLDRANGKGKTEDKQQWYKAKGGWTNDPKQALKDKDGNPIKGAKPGATGAVGKALSASGKRAAAQHKAKAAAPTGKKTETGDKPPKKAVVPKATIAGVRSVGGLQGKVQALVDFAGQHDFKAQVIDDDQGTTVRATRNDWVILCHFVGNGYDESRPAEIHVGSWVGKLRGVHMVRRQMSGVNPPHPQPGTTKSRGSRKASAEDESHEESEVEVAKRRPFNLDDDDIVIIDAIKGKTIRWRNSQTGTMEQAVLPSTANGSKRPKIKITTNPKNHRRIVSFLSVDSVGEHGEVYGPERSVYLDKINRVSG